jgi:YD repeat-containing protein
VSQPLQPEYDESGLLRRVQGPDGVVLECDYDEAARIAQMRMPALGQTVAYAYTQIPPIPTGGAHSEDKGA